MIKQNKKFIELKRINFPIARTGFKYPIKKLSLVGAVCCGVFSFVVPDGSVGFIVGLCLLSPIGFKNAFRDKKETVKDWVVSKYYKMRLRL